jgi:hypothetical protein
VPRSNSVAGISGMDAPTPAIIRFQAIRTDLGHPNSSLASGSGRLQQRPLPSPDDDASRAESIVDGAGDGYDVCAALEVRVCRPILSRL